MKGTPAEVERFDLAAVKKSKSKHEFDLDLDWDGIARVLSREVDFAGLFENSEDGIAPMESNMGFNEDGDWVEFETVMDSGAADCVGDEEMFPEVEVEESRGSKEGRCFTTASGEEVPNRGQKSVAVVTEEGNQKMTTWQMAKVHKPLTAVGKVCDQDNLCIFGKRGGFIRDNNTGQLTRFNRKNGIYIMKLWMRKGGKASSKDFQGQGEW